jgi:metal-sulfur cluster biosynthetic enzyme
MSVSIPTQSKTDQTPTAPTDCPPNPDSSDAAGRWPPANAELKTLNEDSVREALKQVIDPELFVNIIDLGLVYNVDFVPAADDKQTVKIDMTMTSPACPAGPQLISQSKMMVKQMPGVADVEVKIVMDPPWTPDKMTEAARDQLGIF